MRTWQIDGSLLARIFAVIGGSKFTNVEWRISVRFLIVRIKFSFHLSALSSMSISAL